MRTQEIENWALNIADLVSRGKKVEDSRVEIKADWPTDFNKIARRIAGLANAAAGEPVIVMFGLSEEEGLTGILAEIDLAAWWPRVTAEFDHGHPTVKDMRMDILDKQIVVLYFETDNAPYLVKNPAFGITQTPVRLEVPWREGTSVRTANRADLIKLLVPKVKSPHIEIVRATIRESIAKYNSSFLIGYDSQLTLYVTPAELLPVTFPMFKTEGYFEFESGATAQVTIRNYDAEKTEGVNDVTRTSSGITFNGPGMFSMYVYARALPEESNISPTFRLVLKFFAATIALPIVTVKEFKSKLTSEMLVEKLAELNSATVTN